MDSRPLIELEHVDVEISGAAVLHDVSWRLEPGTHWGIVGANGSGKSTFLALLAGERWPAPDRGFRRYHFGGGVRRDAVEARRKIAIVGPELQDRYWRLGWNFAALDVVLSGLFRTDVPRRGASAAETLRARAILRELGLASLAARPFLKLSRGEQRRVLIARAVAFGPRVLLLDEPASGLDAESRGALDEMLVRAARDTQLVVTAHGFEDLPSAVTCVAELVAGRLELRTPPSARRGHAAREAAEPRAVDGHAAARERAGQRTGDAADAPLIVVSHADAWLGGRRVLHGIDWQLHEGENWLVRGANGAGKTSFLRMLQGQLRPALGGSVRWPALGDPRSVWALRRRVTWFAPELQAGYRYRATVRECVASGFDASIGLVRALTAPERARVELLLERFELKPLADRLTTELSYGQFRRALIARTLAPQPRVLLLDEPWEGLDSAASRLLAERLDESLAEGVQLVCASHVAAYGGRFTHELVLEKGRIARADPKRGSSRAPGPGAPGQRGPASLS